MNMLKNEHPKRGRPPKKGSKMVQTGLWLYENQIQWIKEEAARLGITASELLRILIDKARRCVRPDHLFLGTAADNYNDMVSKGRNKCFGIKNNDTNISIKYFTPFE